MPHSVPHHPRNAKNSPPPLRTQGGRALVLGSLLTLLLLGASLSWYDHHTNTNHATSNSPPAPTTTNTTALTTPYIAPRNQNEQPSIPLDASTTSVVRGTTPKSQEIATPLESKEALRERFLPPEEDEEVASAHLDDRHAPEKVAPERQERDPFTEEALATQGANLGPSRWMASLPDTELQAIEEVIAAETARTERTLAQQEREQIFYEHISFLTRRATLRCASHNLPAGARCVVHVQRASLINRRGLLRGVASSANIAAGSRAMERCLDAQLEGARFTLELDDTSLGPLALTVGGAP